MIICSVCGLMIAPNRNARTMVDQQIGAYISHLKKAHGISELLAKKMGNQASIHSILLPEVKTMEDRWMKARLLWEEGKTISEIAETYKLSEKAVRTRIHKWRKEKGWFPVRDFPGIVIKVN